MNKKFGKIAIFLLVSLSTVPYGTNVQAHADSISSKVYSGTTVVSANTITANPEINKDYISRGYVQVRYTNTTLKKMKLSVEKDGKVYYYDFDGNGLYENYPLQMGSGKYIITLLENIQDKEYVEVENWDIDANIEDNSSVYSISNKIVNFDKAAEAISKANALTAGIDSNDKKVEIIYNYLVSNVKYDYDKLKTMQTGYLIDTDSTINSGKGICYDFSVALAVMLRSVGVPTKVLMGYTSYTKDYHSWNAVYLNDNWLIIDTSYDSQAREANAKHNMYKSPDSYQIVKEY